MKGKRIIIFSIVIVVVTMFIFPLILHIPLVKQMVYALLSFTQNPDYKVAYVEFFGAIIGSFMAICGSVWIQSKVDEKQETDRRKKYACIIYNDLDLAFKELIKMAKETRTEYNKKSTNNKNYEELFCKKALGKKIHLSPNWISDVAQLNNVLTRITIQTIYEYYGMLLDIDRALQSRDENEIKKIYSSHIKFLISLDEEEPQSHCQLVLIDLKYRM